jgi:type I restriction-modification system DNA methylase subunit
MAKVKRSNNEMKNGATLSLMATLWAAADKLRHNMDAAEYKHVVLGLIFLKYIERRSTQKILR